MRRNPLVPHVALALALGLAAAARGQQQSPQPADDGGAVRGAFRNTRAGANRAQKKGDGAAQPNAPQRAKPAGAKASEEAPASERKKKDSVVKVYETPPWAGDEVKAKAPVGNGPLPAPAAAGGEKPAGIALGYTLFMRAPTGEATRVSSKREFRSGDAVRLLLEANTDGYLYIFNAENDGRPVLVFPNARLQRGANFIRAHVPYEIPSSAEPDETLRWLVFDDRPALERVYVIVTRKPIEGVPAGEELVKLCAEGGPDACAWSPAPEKWASIKGAGGRGQLATSREADDGRAETAAERDAATRGLGLPADAPLPSVIYMITSANADILVAAFDLIHR